jgi:hypothetical protein
LQAKGALAAAVAGAAADMSRGMSSISPAEQMAIVEAAQVGHISSAAVVLTCFDTLVVKYAYGTTAEQMAIVEAAQVRHDNWCSSTSWNNMSVQRGGVYMQVVAILNGMQSVVSYA